MTRIFFIDLNIHQRTFFREWCVVDSAQPNGWRSVDGAFCGWRDSAQPNGWRSLDGGGLRAVDLAQPNGWRSVDGGGLRSLGSE